jgi:hypothetical protein
MSKIGQSNCPTCQKWIAECQCEDDFQEWDGEDGSITDSAFNDMLEENQLFSP